MRVGLHADDLGFSPAVNDGIEDAIRRGLLTGASVLANAPAATSALMEWRRIEDQRRDGTLPSLEARRMLDEPLRPFDLGVHLNLSQGRPLTANAFPASLLDRSGAFRGVGTFLALMQPGANRHAEAVRRELTAQMEFVLDHAMRPVRVDGHQYCELTPLVGRIVHELAVRFGIAAVRVAREPGVFGTVLCNRGARGMVSMPGAVAKRLLASCYLQRTRRTPLRCPDEFFGTATAGRVGLPEIDRFLAIGLGRKAKLIEIGLHPATPESRSCFIPPESASGDAPWHDPLAETRPDEHGWLVGDELPRLLLRRRVRLGRLA